MKALVASLALFSTLAFAGEVSVMEVDAAKTRSTDFVSVKFSMDSASGLGSAQLTVTREIIRVIAHDTVQYEKTILEEKALIPGLALEGDEAVYSSAEGRVVCGKMGVSRVLRVPTLYLNGNCELVAKRVLTNGEAKIFVSFLSK